MLLSPFHLKLGKAGLQAATTGFQVCLITSSERRLGTKFRRWWTSCVLIQHQSLKLTQPASIALQAEGASRGLRHVAASGVELCCKLCGLPGFGSPPNSGPQAMGRRCRRCVPGQRGASRAGFRASIEAPYHSACCCVLVPGHGESSAACQDQEPGVPGGHNIP